MLIVLLLCEHFKWNSVRQSMAWKYLVNFPCRFFIWHYVWLFQVKLGRKPIFWQKFWAENCMKMKEISRGGEGTSLVPLPGIRQSLWHQMDSEMSEAMNIFSEYINTTCLTTPYGIDDKVGKIPLGIIFYDLKKIQID